MMLTYYEGCNIDPTLLSFEIGTNFLKNGLTFFLNWHAKEEWTICSKEKVGI